MQETIDRFIPLGTATETCCPACEEETLRVGSIDDNDVLYCRKCRGFLIGCETMGSVVADRRSKYQGPDDIQKPLNSRELQRNIRCPACQKKMDVHPYHGPSNVVIDSCSECHLVWLDHGELARIEIAPGRRVSAYRS
jgi:Zn-finger nucleic acid-binding protein